MRTILTLALALLIASPAIALAKGEKKPAPCPATQFVNQMTKNLTLTDDQKTKLEGFEKEFGPKMVDAAKAGDVLTPEQKKARHEAEKAAKLPARRARTSSKRLTTPPRSRPSRRPR